MRVSGLSPFLDLGQRVGYEVDGVAEVAEVVRLERGSAIVKPFGTRTNIRLGLAVKKSRRLRLRAGRELEGPRTQRAGRPRRRRRPAAPGSRCAWPQIATRPLALGRGRVKNAPAQPACAPLTSFVHSARASASASSRARASASRPCWRCSPAPQVFDTVVIALVGERGREVREFIEDALGANAKRAVTVVATGDESPMMRRLAARTATGIAECFPRYRPVGAAHHRLGDALCPCRAGRGAGGGGARRVARLSAERLQRPAAPPGARRAGTGWPRQHHRHLLRAGGRGTITTTPSPTRFRGTLDGHIVLDRKIAAQGRYPAIDLMASLSRLAQHVWTPEQRTLVGKLREMIARFEDTRDLRAMGAYQAGGDAELDQAITLVPRILRGADAVAHHTTQPRRLPGPFDHAAEAPMSRLFPLARGASHSGDWIWGALGICIAGTLGELRRLHDRDGAERGRGVRIGRLQRLRPFSTGGPPMPPMRPCRPPPGGPAPGSRTRRRSASISSRQDRSARLLPPPAT